MNAALAIVTLQIGVSVAVGFAAAATLSGDTITYLISYAPGGLAEMSIIAVAMQLEAAFVALNHLLRLTLSLLIAPLLLRFVK
ncbi:Putative ammonia monooxygenase [Nitrincola nitratireducens]|uniref:Putative ammonia monooxygenase n=1 Tax=Nitrincola nitratireducens TaxID=1229521 RepID=W9VQ69_9GAMM|nr:Putative ammonia monooxygenase [Nitrincola nitratireducens]